MEERRSYKDLEEFFNNERKMNEFCLKIVKEYLSIKNGHPRSYICDTYWITRSCYYACLKRVVVRGIVTDVQINEMMVRAISNQRYNAPDGVVGTRTQENYRKYIEERKKYLEDVLSKATDSRKARIAKLYAEDISETIYSLGLKENLPYAAVSKFIEYAIINNLVDDEIVKKIQNKTLTYRSRNLVIEQFKAYKEAREKAKKE